MAGTTRKAPGETRHVGIVILNYNRAEEIADCLDSVFASTYPDFRVIFVDNASRDASIETLESWAGGRVRVDWTDAVDQATASEAELTVIKAGSNLGYAGGHNLGVSAALKRGAAYVLLLNSDITVEPDFLTRLVAAAEAEGTGAAGPAVLDYFNRDVVLQAGAEVQAARGRVRGLGRGKHVDELGMEPREVDSLMGCAVLVSAEAFERVGLFDTRYFMYLEESDWFIRAKKLGYRTLLVPGARVWHKEDMLGRRKKAVTSAYYFARNRLILVRKNFPDSLASAMAWSLRHGILDKTARRSWAELRMSLLGIADFLKGRTGRREFGDDGAGTPGVVVFTTDYKPATGGIAEHAYRVALGLQETGLEVTVLAPELEGCDAFDADQPFGTRRIPRLRGLEWPLYASVLFHLAASGRAQLVYCATSHPCGLICALLNAVVSLWFTVTIHAHEAIYTSVDLRQRFKKSLRALQVWVFSRARRVYAVSRFTRDALVDAGVSEKKVAVVNNGVAADELLGLAEESRITEDLDLKGRRIILTIARLDVHKGHDIVIKAMPEILKKVPDAVYVIVGEGVMGRRLEKLAEDLEVSDRVILSGQLSRQDLAVLLRACEVFVLNSRLEGGNAEGFGIVLLEAAVFRKPVVAGRSGGIPDAVEDGVTGILVDPLDPEEVAGAVVRILKDPGLASRLGEAGYARATTEFTWQKVTERILANLEKRCPSPIGKSA